ncbi:transcription antitermination factor NusB [Helicobacter sp. T3_23-1056]
MATRTHAREAVIALLYAYQSGNANTKDFAPNFLESRKIKNKQKDFALGLFGGVMEHLESIDFELAQNLQEWDFERLGQMEKSILRLGAYEIAHTSTQSAIVINEAIELAKNYADENATKLINGVLDKIKKVKQD